MKTKEYIKPEVVVVKIQPQAILAGSGDTIEQGDDTDYSEDNLDKFKDKDQSIWGD